MVYLLPNLGVLKLVERGVLAGSCSGMLVLSMAWSESLRIYRTWFTSRCEQYLGPNVKRVPDSQLIPIKIHMIRRNKQRDRTPASITRWHPMPYPIGLYGLCHSWESLQSRQLVVSLLFASADMQQTKSRDIWKPRGNCILGSEPARYVADCQCCLGEQHPECLIACCVVSTGPGGSSHPESQCSLPPMAVQCGTSTA